MPRHRAHVRAAVTSWDALTPVQRTQLLCGSPAGLECAFGTLDAARASWEALRDHPRLTRGHPPCAAERVFSGAYVEPDDPRSALS